MTKILLEFYEEIERKVKALMGFVVINNTKDSQELIVLSLWEKQRDVDIFYQPSNAVFLSLLTKHLHYLRIHQKGLTIQYRYLKYRRVSFFLTSDSR